MWNWLPFLVLTASGIASFQGGVRDFVMRSNDLAKLLEIHQYFNMALYTCVYIIL